MKDPMKKRMKFSDLFSRYFLVALLLFFLAREEARADEGPPALPGMDTIEEELEQIIIDTDGEGEPPVTELDTDPDEGLPANPGDQPDDGDGDDDTNPGRTYIPPGRTTTPSDYTTPTYTPPPTGDTTGDDDTSGDDNTTGDNDTTGDNSNSDGDENGDGGDDKKDPVDDKKEEEKKTEEPAGSGAVTPTPAPTDQDNQNQKKDTTASVARARTPKKLVSSGPETFLLFGIALCASFFGYFWTKERNYKL